MAKASDDREKRAHFGQRSAWRELPSEPPSAIDPICHEMRAAIASTMLALVGANVHFERTVNSLSGATAKAVIDGPACAKMDDYGSNMCDLEWGAEYTVHADVALTNDLTAGSRVEGDFKLEGLIPFKFSCPLCGGDCTVKVPIVGKEITVTMPDCPLSGLSYDDAKTFTLPAKSPLPAEISAKGNIKAYDASGAVVADIDLEGKLGAEADIKMARAHAIPALEMLVEEARRRGARAESAVEAA